MTDPAGSAAAVFGALQEKTRPSRPLCLPLFAALASEADGSAPGAFLRNPGRLALVLRDMARTLPIDVLMVDSGSLWELEIAGFSVDSTTWPPRLRGGSLRPVPSDLAAASRVSPTLEALRRLKEMVGQLQLGVVVTGTARFQALTGADGSMWLQTLLSIVRLALEAGANVILIHEGPPAPTDAARWSKDLSPVWGTIQFYRGVAALLLVEPESGWLPVLETGNPPFIPIVDERATELLNAVRRRELWGVARQLDISQDDNSAAGAAMVTTAGDLWSQIPVDQLRDFVQELRFGTDPSVSQQRRPLPYSRADED